MRIILFLIILISNSYSLMIFRRFEDVDLTFFEETKYCNSYFCSGLVNIKIDGNNNQLSFTSFSFNRNVVNKVCIRMGFDYFNSYGYQCRNSKFFVKILKIF